MSLSYKPFILCGILFLSYGLFLKYEKNNWINTKSIVRNVTSNDTIITEVNGLDISEIESNADVVYKINDDIYINNINVIKNQPLQLGNVIPIKYDKNIIDRKEKGIPNKKYWNTMGSIFIILGLYLYSKRE